MMNSSDQITSGGGYSISTGLTYGILFCVGVFLIIFLLIIFDCTRLRFPHNRPSHRNSGRNLTTIEEGVDEATLSSYPKLLYSQVKKGSSTASCCSICLVDYRETDMLRLLPDCAHLFHLNCVDPWIRKHPTCPICRNKPVAGQHTSLVAEVDTLATGQDN
ncbi:hypothetical protein FH972_010516 [Carpinus fangiana]|uniref:RING-type domain-containing protein n=1 Tax=Carpinus fangiana TaxID=176857 RepID=A0A660KNJ0_9ROSI|nr:hypothetical protein FH972_010516 [Carpinus fangiana]